MNTNIFRKKNRIGRSAEHMCNLPGLFKKMTKGNYSKNIDARVMELVHGLCPPWVQYTKKNHLNSISCRISVTHGQTDGQTDKGVFPYSRWHKKSSTDVCRLHVSKVVSIQESNCWFQEFPYSAFTAVSTEFFSLFVISLCLRFRKQTSIQHRPDEKTRVYTHS